LDYEPPATPTPVASVAIDSDDRPTVPSARVDTVPDEALAHEATQAETAQDETPPHEPVRAAEAEARSEPPTQPVAAAARKAPPPGAPVEAPPAAAPETAEAHSAEPAAAAPAAPPLDDRRRLIEALAMVRRPAAPAPRPLRAGAARLPVNIAAGIAILAACGTIGWYVVYEHDRPIDPGAMAAPPKAPAPVVAAPAAPAGPRKIAVPQASSQTLLALAAIEHRTQPQEYQRIVRLEKGGTLEGILARAGVGREEGRAALATLAGVQNIRNLRAGRPITVRFGVHGREHNQFIGIVFDSRFDLTVKVDRQARGDFIAGEVKKNLSAQLMRGNGIVEHSVFQAGLQAGLQPEPIMRMINMFSYDVDFQRDIQPKDSFEILYEIHRDPRGDIVKHGEIVYAALILGGNPIRLYRFQLDDGTIEYFNEKGENPKKLLMRTPIDGARLSSGFGLRRHPILGYTRQHQGVDFAAPIGTPIYAAGHGTIERIGWNGGYGNAIEIKHNQGYMTRYAHMTGFAPGLKLGSRVTQGQIIGYVGSTGMSTGPHLHYEVHQNAKPIDPMSLKLPTRQKLTGPEGSRFLETVRAVDARYHALGRNLAAGPGFTDTPVEETERGCSTTGVRIDPFDKRPCASPVQPFARPQPKR
jgi:murein DD-endopeptidase MepM/ murein hydrolase activator NlpD